SSADVKGWKPPSTSGGRGINVKFLSQTPTNSSYSYNPTRNYLLRQGRSVDNASESPTIPAVPRSDHATFAPGLADLVQIFDIQTFNVQPVDARALHPDSFDSQLRRRA